MRARIWSVRLVATSTGFVVTAVPCLPGRWRGGSLRSRRQAVCARCGFVLATTRRESRRGSSPGRARSRESPNAALSGSVLVCGVGSSSPLTLVWLVAAVGGPLLGRPRAPLRSGFPLARFASCTACALPAQRAGFALLARVDRRNRPAAWSYERRQAWRLRKGTVWRG
jgi:hypothetical protein